MKQALEHLKKPGTRYTGKPTKNTLGANLVSAIFERFRVRYRGLWTKAIGESEKEIAKAVLDWSVVLGEFDAAQIKAGFDGWTGTKPPNVMEFRECCKAARRRGAHVIRQALPRPARNKAVAAGAVQEMRKSIRQAQPTRAAK